MLQKIKGFVKKEVVLCISAFFAALTMIIIPPDGEYLGYIDFRVLCLLFCLMAVVAGMKSVGVFSYMTYQLLHRLHNGRILSLVLVLLPFFTSMVVTNDVALIVFVPFTIALLSQIGIAEKTVHVIVLQTVAANLGSMATPIGNPQNLFLYSNFNLSAGEFFSVTLPLTAISLILLALASSLVLPENLQCSDFKKEKISDSKKLIVYFVLFILCIFTVFRVIPFVLTTVIIVLAMMLVNKKLFIEIDFMLLLTFVCFFIISENLGRIEPIRAFLQELLSKNTLLTSVGASQVISNVPAAVLLSGFTEDWKALLAGVNIGGLGTPVASLASLITLKFYLKSCKSNFMKFFIVFTVANVIGLILLLFFQCSILK